MSDKEAIQAMLNKRNTGTIFEVVNVQNKKIQELEEQLSGLRAALQTALNQIGELNITVNLLRGQIAGNGRTVI